MTDKTIYKFYAEKGIPVFPVKLKRGEDGTNKKIPLTKNGFLDASTDIDIVNKMFECDYDFIGVPNGSRSFYVVDIDCQKTGQNYLDIVDIIQEHYGDLPDTFTVQTVSAGYHLYYYSEIEIKRKTGFLKNLPVDFLGCGGYSVAADDSAYCPLDSSYANIMEEIKPLPQWIIDFLGEKKEVKKSVQKNYYVDDDQFSPIYNEIEEKKHVENMLKFIDSTPRDNWVNVGIALKESREKWGYETWCEWSKTSELYEEKDQLYRWSTFKPTGSMTIASIFYQAKEHGYNIVESECSEDGQEWVCDESMQKPTLRKKKPFPDHLLSPPGLTGDICQYIESISFKPQPILAVASTLAFLGSVMGQRVQTDRGTRTNIYTVGVAEQGSGKESARIAIKQICEAMSIEKYCAVNNIASDSAITTAIQSAPCQVFLIDEVGRFLSTTQESKNAHKQEIITQLLTLYSSASSTFFGKIYADKDKQAIVSQPCVSIYGCTVPINLYENLKMENLLDGFVSRLLFFESEDPDPVERDIINISKQIPTSILAGMQAILELPTNANGLRATSSFAKEPIDPRVVKFSEESRKKINDYKAYIRKLRAELRESSRPDGILARSGQIAEQIALIIQIGTNVHSKTVDIDATNYAVDLVKYLSENMLYIAENFISHNELHSELNKIRSKIVNSKNGIDRSQLTRFAQHINRRTRDEILATLVDSGEIESVSVRRQGSKKQTTIYRGI